MLQFISGYKNNKSMNILLWILQILLSFYYITGGIFLSSNYQILANSWALNNLSKTFWLILSTLEIIFAVGLILPGLIKPLRKLLPISAIGLALVSLSGIFIYSAYTGLGILWAITPTALLVFIAMRRSLPSKTK